MTAALEQALQVLAEKLAEQAKGVPDMSGGYVLNGLAAAHAATADQLQREREAREQAVERKPGDPTYDPKGKAKP